MDVVELTNVSDIYRLVPTEDKLLKPIKINESEKSKKLVRVTTKTTINKGKLQIGFHDGRSIISDTKVNVGDVCLIQVPEQKILEVIKLEAGTQGIVTRGHNTGQIGKIEKAFLGSDGVGRALVRFGRSQKAEEIFQAVIDDMFAELQLADETLAK